MRIEQSWYPFSRFCEVLPTVPRDSLMSVRSTCPLFTGDRISIRQEKDQMISTACLDLATTPTQSCTILGCGRNEIFLASIYFHVNDRIVPEHICYFHTHQPSSTDTHKQKTWAHASFYLQDLKKQSYHAIRLNLHHYIFILLIVLFLHTTAT